MRVKKRWLLLLMVFCLARVVSGQDVSQSKATLAFEGNKVFSTEELLAVTKKCLAAGTRNRAKLDGETLEYCLSRLQVFLGAKGYLQATIGTPKEQQSDNGPRLLVPITEGALYRLGEVEITNSKLLFPSQIREMLDLKSGEIANGDRISVWLYENVARVYKNFGYVQFSAEVEPSFNLGDNATEGVVNLKVTIDEGRVFTIRSIKFEGNGNVSEDELRRELLVRNGEIFNKELFDESLKRISQSGQFESIDVDKDVNYEWKDPNPRLDLTIRLKRKL